MRTYEEIIKENPETLFMEIREDGMIMDKYDLIDYLQSTFDTPSIYVCQPADTGGVDFKYGEEVNIDNILKEIKNESKNN